MTSDKPLDEVYAWWTHQSNLAERLTATLRQAFDEVIDGPRTGRYRYTALEKTEKTYLGTKVEILLRHEFKLNPGRRLDYEITGHEIDCKFTGKNDNWTIPREAAGQICLLVGACEERREFRFGLVRCDTALLNSGENRDAKRTLNTAGIGAVRWLVAAGRLPPAFLATLAADDVAAIMRPSKGQQRVNELFRRVHDRIVPREAIATVVRGKDDPLKRVRANGGARTSLAPEGIIILGHQEDHPRIAADFGLVPPSKGSFIAIRIVPADGPPAVEIAGTLWRRAGPGDPPSACPARY